MKYSVSNIMTKTVYKINAEDGVIKAGRIMDENGVNCLPVYDNGCLAGIITSKDIRKAHPNRIVADAMSEKTVSITPETSIWEALKILEKNSIERVLIIDDEDFFVGIVTKTSLLAELGKHTDLLTGLHKSGYISNQVSELLANGVEVAVIFIDLDKFGLIDKEYGHVVGDIILKEVSGILIENTPKETHICRYGGDEFVVITPFNTDKCKVLAENLLNAISTHVFYNGLNVNASAGISTGAIAKSTHSSLLSYAKILINLASLASTKAKKENSRIIIAENISAIEIA